MTANPLSRDVVSSLSRCCSALACVLALGTGAEALAQDSSVSTASEAPSDPGPAFRRFGVLLDVGVPDGIAVSAVVRPLEWLRLNGGITSNTLSFGLRGGISLVPLSSIVSPSFNADFGHYFDTSYNKLVDRLGGSGLQTQAPIEDVGYNYASASVGLEVGSPNRFAAYLRVGLSYASLSIDDAEALLQDVADDPDITAKPLSLRFTTPSIKLGFLFYFF